MTTTEHCYHNDKTDQDDYDLDDDHCGVGGGWRVSRQGRRRRLQNSQQ
jgi:hypothetical protein